MHRRPRAARGFTLIETCVASTMATILVYLVALSGIEFTRGAGLIAARAALMREADMATAYLVDSLRIQGVAPAPPDDGDGVQIGVHRYRVVAGSLRRVVVGANPPDARTVAWNVGAIVLVDGAITLTMRDPAVVENRKTGAILEREIDLRVVVP